MLRFTLRHVNIQVSTQTVPASMPTTLKDIATQAGVSINTVSRITRGDGASYHPDTRDRVLRIARDLDYRPNHLSRALLGGQSMAVGLLMRGLGGRVTSIRIRSILDAAQKQGYLVYVVNLEGDIDRDSEQFASAVRELIARGVDGLMVYRGVPLSPDARRFLNRQSVPTVFLDWGPPRSTHRVIFDRQVGWNELASHLAGLGHQTVAFIPSLHSYHFREHRILPAARAMSRHGIELQADRKWAVDTESSAEDVAYETVKSYLATRPTATALVMSDDQCAAGALAAARDLGLGVPDEVSITGFGDTAGARYCTPALTTIRTPRGEVGQSAFAMLHRLMTSPDASVEKEKFPTRLVARGSTGPARLHGLFTDYQPNMDADRNVSSSV